MIDTLQADIEKYSSLGEILLIGDLNSRIGEIQETKTIVTNDNIYIIDENDCEYLEYHRSNKDTVVNTNGKRMLTIINENNMLTVNGRTVGDLKGEYTHVDPQGHMSTIDTCMVSNDLLKNVVYFKVGQFEWFTDHAPICLTIRTDTSF